MKQLNPIIIEATDFGDAWFQALYNVLHHGRSFKIDRGSYEGQTRLELDFVTIHITYPWLRDLDCGLPLIPIIPEHMDIPAPVTKEYVAEYVQYLMSHEKREGEQYTYGQRLCRATVPSSNIDDIYDINITWLNQIEYVIYTYQKYGWRNNQMVLQVAQPADLLLSDPPCLRHIDTRIQDGALHFYPYFRSWSMWGGFPANLAGISVLQEYMASQLGVQHGEIIVTSKGLHLYDFEENIARMRCMVKLNKVI